MKTSNLIPHRLSHIVSWKFWKRIRGFIRGFCSVQTLPPLVSSGKRGVVDFPDSNVHHTHWALVVDSLFLYLFFTQALHLGQPRGPMITLSWSNTCSRSPPAFLSPPPPVPTPGPRSAARGRALSLQRDRRYSCRRSVVRFVRVRCSRGVHISADTCTVT